MQQELYLVHPQQTVPRLRKLEGSAFVELFATNSCQYIIRIRQCILYARLLGVYYCKVQ